MNDRYSNRVVLLAGAIVLLFSFFLMMVNCADPLIGDGDGDGDDDDENNFCNTICHRIIDCDLVEKSGAYSMVDCRAKCKNWLQGFGDCFEQASTCSQLATCLDLS